MRPAAPGRSRASAASGGLRAVLASCPRASTAACGLSASARQLCARAHGLCASAGLRRPGREAAIRRPPTAGGPKPVGLAHLSALGDGQAGSKHRCDQEGSGSQVQSGPGKGAGSGAHADRADIAGMKLRRSPESGVKSAARSARRRPFPPRRMSTMLAAEG